MRPVLYALVCGSPVARGVGDLVQGAQADGWDVCLVATPSATAFLDVPSLAELTGHPVRSRYKNPTEPDLLPPADAMVVAPATCNTVNKWAAGISDTLVLGLLTEALGLSMPIVAAPYSNAAHVLHPAFRDNLARLTAWGVRVMFGDDFCPLPAPNSGRHPFPWGTLRAAVREYLPSE